MKYFITSIFSIIVVFSTNAQTIHVKGLVVDAENNIPVGFCNVYIQSYPQIGTYSNENGEFLLNVPIEFAEDSIIVSFVGYAKAVKNITSFKNASVVKLEPRPIELKEVVIIPTKDTLANIVRTAIKNIPKNYPQKTYYMDAFYRELSMRDSTYVRLLEAAIGIQDKGFDRLTDQIRIEVIGVRKSEDYLKYSGYSDIHRRLYGETNNLYKTIKFDEIRNYNKDGFKFLESLFIRPFYFSLDTIKILNDEKIYVIEYHSQNKGNFEEKGNLYINANDYGILHFEYQNFIESKENAKGEDEIFFNGKIYKSSIVEYRKIDDKYYLSYIKWLDPVRNAWKVEEDEGNSIQYFNCALYVHQVYTKKKDFDKISLRNTQLRNKDVFNQDLKYDPEFWNNFNMVLINPLLMNVKDDLEKEKPLDRQFSEQ